MNEKISNEDLAIALFQSAEDVEMRELVESRRDIKMARDKLGQFSLGDMFEAIYGEDYAAEMRRTLGEELYETKMENISLETKVVDGGVSTRLSSKLIEQLTGKKEPDKTRLSEALDKQADEIDFTQMMKALSEMSQSERDALMTLAKKMGRKS